MLRASGVSFAYGATQVLADAWLDVAEGRLVGVVGPNGAGKSTLLRCLYGALQPASGDVRIGGRDLRTLGRREIARQVGVVPQQCHPAFPVSVEHFVGLGRFAREPLLAGPNRADREAVARALAQMDLDGLKQRVVDELSGGEFRRVLIAQALAQEPRILLFDEPIQQLDLRHQLEVMEFARGFARRGGTAAVVVLHDLGLAARYCDTLTLLHRGRVLASGPPDQVLTERSVEQAFGVRAAILRLPPTGTIHVLPLEPCPPETPGNEPTRRRGPP
jgi:iron complex transport system ATP-binding protein